MKPVATHGRLATTTVACAPRTGVATARGSCAVRTLRPIEVLSFKGQDSALSMRRRGFDSRQDRHDNFPARRKRADLEHHHA